MTDPYLTVLEDLGKSEMAVYRLNMVQYALEHGIAPAARFYKTSRKNVRKWVSRFLMFKHARTTQRKKRGSL